MPSSPHPTSAHRKIELQSPADLTYLITQAQTSSTSKLSTAFPTIDDPSSDDVMRGRVASLLDEFLARTYAGVRANVSVNGMDVGGGGRGGGEDGAGREVHEEQERYEDFDARIAERIRELEGRKEVLTERVADLRRTGAETGAEKWRAGWEGRINTTVVDEIEDGVTSEEKLVEENNLRRWDQVQGSYIAALEDLVKQKGSMGSIVGQLAEAKKVSEELE
jgi:kinetochor protein Mis14/NSL1